MHDKNVQIISSNRKSKPALSLILCSRNDQYMGNSRWRLEITLNYVAQKVHELGRKEDVEVLVADWGSEIPLRNVLELSPEAARIVSFILIPPEIARDLQKDSPFPEVLALNAAVRQARGEYIGRIDQDTLVGERFLEYFFALYEGKQQLTNSTLNSVMLFASRRKVPFRFAVREPGIHMVDRFIRLFGSHLKIEEEPGAPFYYNAVGILLLHRRLWIECSGYDEGMIYMNGMEVNMIHRLMQRYELKDLGRIVDYHFYHLEHYHPREPRIASRYRNLNSKSFLSVSVFYPNKANWGLEDHLIEVLFSMPDKIIPHNLGTIESPIEWLSFTGLLLRVGMQIIIDVAFLSLREMMKILHLNFAILRHRATIARTTVSGQRITRWPALLLLRWKQRNRH